MIANELPWVICDIDGVLADCSWRLPYIIGDKKDWEQFHTHALYDPPMHSMIHLLKKFAQCHKIALFTARPERFRAITEQWLNGKEVPFDELHMRNDDDSRRSWGVKESMLVDNFCETNRIVTMAIDDRDSIIRMWRRHGILSIQVHTPQMTYDEASNNEKSRES